MRLGDFTADRVLATRAEVLAERLLYGLDHNGSLDAPFAARFGVLGAGIGVHAGGCAVIAVDAEMFGAGLVPAEQNAAAATALRAITLPGEDWQTGVYAWGLPPLVQQVQSGDKVRGAGNGTAGARVEWTDTSGTTVEGILTAGHVVKSAKSVTTRGGIPIGSVADCRLAASGGIDVAAIELAAAAAPRLSGPVGLTAGTAIEIAVGPSPARDTVVGKFGWFYSYTDLYMTLGIVTFGGDSGSAAVRPGTREFVGTLIGASSGSLVQDGRSQLAALATKLAGITI